MLLELFQGGLLCTVVSELTHLPEARDKYNWTQTSETYERFGSRLSRWKQWRYKMYCQDIQVYSFEMQWTDLDSADSWWKLYHMCVVWVFFPFCSWISQFVSIQPNDNVCLWLVKLKNVKHKIWKAATSTIWPNLVKLALPCRYSWPGYSLDKTN